MNPIWLPLAQAHADGSREIVDNLARTPLSQIVIFVTVLSILRLGLYFFLIKPKPHQRTPLHAAGSFVNEMLDAFIYAGVFVFMVIRPFGVQAFLIPSGSMWPQLYVNDFIVANKAVYRYTDPQHGDVVVFHPPSTAAIYPTDLDAHGEMKFDFVKRCIGVPGDLIEIKQGVLYRNGQKVDEPYTAYTACTTQEPCQDFRLLSPDEKKQLILPSFKLVTFKGRLIPLNYTEFDANSLSPQGNFFLNHRTYDVAKEFAISDPAEQREAMKLPAERLPKDDFLMMGDNRDNSFDGRAWGLVSRDRIVGRSEFVWWPLSQMQRTR